ncbi:hypothetical protein [Aneurinibacillus terranovensis]|uniref:hypothetical protein n=1 Tax=Aneurinibacillus terranovensis TaxID=278991 RepID=UPI001B7FE7FB
MFIEIDEVERAMHTPEPWYIDRCQFNEELQQLDVFVKYRKRGLFTCQGMEPKSNRYMIRQLKIGHGGT